MNFLKKLFAPRTRTTPVTSCCDVDARAGSSAEASARPPQPDAATNTRPNADGVCQTHGCTPAVAERPTVPAGAPDAKHGCCE